MKKRPYWLMEGSEVCHGCSFRHVLEMELRCAACDRGFCQHCVAVVTETRDWLCSECSGAAEEED